jgi:hypothetical protein
VINISKEILVCMYSHARCWISLHVLVLNTDFSVYLIRIYENDGRDGSAWNAYSS